MKTWTPECLDIDLQLSCKGPRLGKPVSTSSPLFEEGRPGAAVDDPSSIFSWPQRYNKLDIFLVPGIQCSLHPPLEVDDDDEAV